MRSEDTPSDKLVTPKQRNDHFHERLVAVLNLDDEPLAVSDTPVKVLSIGCGDDPESGVIRRLYPASSRVKYVGIDSSTSDIAKLNESKDIPEDDVYVCADASDYDAIAKIISEQFASDAVDLIVFRHPPIIFYQSKPTFDEIIKSLVSKFLSVGGKLVVSNYYPLESRKTKVALASIQDGDVAALAPSENAPSRIDTLSTFFQTANKVTLHADKYVFAIRSFKPTAEAISLKDKAADLCEDVPGLVRFSGMVGF